MLLFLIHHIFKILRLFLRIGLIYLIGPLYGFEKVFANNINFLRLLLCVIWIFCDIKDLKVELSALDCCLDESVISSSTGIWLLEFKFLILLINFLADFHFNISSKRNHNLEKLFLFVVLRRGSWLIFSLGSFRCMAQFSVWPPDVSTFLQ